MRRSIDQQTLRAATGPLLTVLAVWGLWTCSSEPGEVLNEQSDELSLTGSTCLTLQRGGVGTVADAYVRAHRPESNFGLRSRLRVSTDTLSLIRFSLEAIPRDAKVDRAVLRLHVSDGERSCIGSPSDS